VRFQWGSSVRIAVCGPRFCACGRAGRGGRKVVDRVLGAVEMPVVCLDAFVSICSSTYMAPSGDVMEGRERVP
jgi:hypothetical protein